MKEKPMTLPIPTPPPRITLQEAYNQFMRKDRARSTIDSYEKFLPRFINAIGPSVPVYLIEPGVIEDFFHELRERKTKFDNHPQRPQVSEGLSPFTVRSYLKMVRALFAFCVKREWITKSPAADVELRNFRRPSGVSKAVSPEELDAIIHASKQNASRFLLTRDYAIVLFLVATGCRAGGVASVRLDRLNLQERYAILEEKGDNLTKVYFGEKTEQALRQWLDNRPVGLRHPFVFVSTKGFKPLTARSLADLIERLARRAGIDRPVGPHSIRHRVGQAWADAGMPATLVQQKLGHSNVSVTLNHYFNQDDERLRYASTNWEMIAVTGGQYVSPPPTPEEEKRTAEIINIADYRRA